LDADATPLKSLLAQVGMGKSAPECALACCVLSGGQQQRVRVKSSSDVSVFL